MVDFSQDPIPPSARDAAIRAVRQVLDADERIRWAYVFGSVARAESFADVDVALRLQDGVRLSLREFARLGRRVAEGLGRPEFPVDVVDVAVCSLPLMDAILREGIVIVDRSPGVRHHWEMEATLRWLDFRPTWDEQTRLRHLAATSHGPTASR